MMMMNNLLPSCNDVTMASGGAGGGGGGRTPKGHFVVYVGEELRRYVLPTSYLKNPFFQKLLEEAAEEYGFCSHKGIVLPCHKSTFHRMLIRLHHFAP